MRDLGALNRLRKEWLADEVPVVKSSWVVVELRNAIPLLIILTAGILMGCLFLLIEKLWHKFQDTDQASSVNYAVPEN